MVGQAPSAKGSRDPRHALTGAPMRRIFKVSGIELMTYVRTFERHNLVAHWHGYRRRGDPSSGSRFDEREAGTSALVLADRLAGRRRLLCWGGVVAKAFIGVAADSMPPLEWQRHEVPGLDDVYDAAVAVLPHPSGLNRWWNDPANAAAAGVFIREVVRDFHLAKATCRRQSPVLNQTDPPGEPCE